MHGEADLCISLSTYAEDTGLGKMTLFISKVIEEVVRMGYYPRIWE